MSSDEDDGMEMQSMVAAAAARAAVAGLATETYAFDKTAYPELYKPAEQHMKEHNRDMCDSEVSKQLRKVFDATCGGTRSGQGNHFWFMGAIEKKLATDLYLSANSFYDHKSGTMVVEHTEGKSKGSTTIPGFSTYEHHLGKHDPAEQSAASVFFPGTFFKRVGSARKIWPATL